MDVAQAYVTDKAPKGSHIITANEGAAVAMAAGHYFATRKPAMVYLQNSGIGTWSARHWSLSQTSGSS